MMGGVTNTPQYAFRFDPELRDELRRLAAARGISQSEALHEAVLQWVLQERRKGRSTSR